MGASKLTITIKFLLAIAAIYRKKPRYKNVILSLTVT